jgi:hypothetical protein
VNGNPWTSVAEFTLKGCYTNVNTEKFAKNPIQAFPVPATGILTLSLPGHSGKMECRMISSEGKKAGECTVEVADGNACIDISGLMPGVYLLVLTDRNGITFRVKVMKQ